MQSDRKDKMEVATAVEFIELPPGGMSVEQLAVQLAVNSSEVIKELFMKGIMVTVNQARIACPAPRASDRPFKGLCHAPP